MKKWLLLTLVLPALIAGSLIVLGSASALGPCGLAVCVKTDITGATYDFVAVDKMEFTADFAGEMVTFTDTQPNLKNHVYAPDDPGKFCKGAKIKIFKDDYNQNVDPMPALTKIQVWNGKKCVNPGAQHILVDLP